MIKKEEIQNYINLPSIICKPPTTSKWASAACCLKRDWNEECAASTGLYWSEWTMNLFARGDTKSPNFAPLSYSIIRWISDSGTVGPEDFNLEFRLPAWVKSEASWPPRITRAPSIASRFAITGALPPIALRVDFILLLAFTNFWKKSRFDTYLIQHSTKSFISNTCTL